MSNGRFIGAWMLKSFETEQADGSITRPWGDDPLGIVCWDASGYFSAQLGPRRPSEAFPYVAYFGTLSAPNSERGTLVHKVLGSSNPERLNGEQVREFEFVDSMTLILRPPKTAAGAQSTLTWRRCGH